MKKLFLLLLISFTGLGVFAQGTSINDNGAPADSSAMLDVSADDKGLLIPRLTTAQRDAISNPAEGLIIYNSDIQCIQFHISGGNWSDLCSAPPCPKPDPPTAGSHVALATEITWNWNSPGGITGFKYNTTNDYSTATDVGLTTSYTQTGLTCAAAQTLYVWSYNTCGESSVLTLNANTFACVGLQCMAVGGTGSEQPYSISNTIDGGLFLVGHTNSFGAGANDFYAVKISPTGTLQWTRTIGGSSGESEAKGYPTSDGGYILAGSTKSYAVGDDDGYLVKLDASGNVSWAKAIGGPGPYGDFFKDVTETSDGGYIACGSTYDYGQGKEDFYIVKTDGSGNLAWAKAFGGTNTDRAFGVTQVADGGYVIVGGTESFGVGGWDTHLLKLDASGNMVWNLTVGSTAGAETAREVVATTDGGVVFGGYTDGFGQGSYDVHAGKIDASGNLVWTTTIGSSGLDVAFGVDKTADGGYILSGYSNQISGSGTDVYLVKLDANGDLEWDNTYGGASVTDEGFAAVELSSGGYAIAGQAESFGQGSKDFYIITATSTGDACCSISGGGVQDTGGLTGSGGVLTTINPSVGSGSSSGSGGTLSTQCN